MYARMTARIDLENPMVLGDYYPAKPRPNDIITCPVCGRTWEAYGEGWGREWVTADESVSTHLEPTRNGCWECVISHSDEDDFAKYIVEHRLQKEALEWCICSHNDWRGWIDEDYVPLMWQTLKPLLMHEGRLQDFVEDQYPETYREWALDR